MASLAELREQFPNWKIRQDPWTDCHACKGTGKITPESFTRSQPCFCAVSSMPHGEEKKALMKSIGRVAKKLGEELREETNR